jgi:hypothetical protein
VSTFSSSGFTISTLLGREPPALASRFNDKLQTTTGGIIQIRYDGSSLKQVLPTGISAVTKSEPKERITDRSTTVYSDCGPNG